MALMFYPRNLQYFYISVAEACELKTQLPIFFNDMAFVLSFIKIDFFNK
jgi:hypothetical protein